MSKDAQTPRVYLLRHGATEWSKNGRYTGISDIPLLPEGERSVQQTAAVVFGAGRLIDPAKLARVYVSPRSRAKRTLSLLLDSLPEATGDGHNPRKLVQAKVVESEAVAEWKYGDYEGLFTSEVKGLRKQRGHADGWDIWKDGTEGEGSEGPDDVARRIDAVILEITQLQGRWMDRARVGDDSEAQTNGVQEAASAPAARGCDVLVVAHGHSLRAFVKRWLGLEMQSKAEMMLEPGGVCGLSYAHGNVEERALLVGMSFPQS